MGYFTFFFHTETEFWCIFYTPSTSQFDGICPLETYVLHLDLIKFTVKKIDSHTQIFPNILKLFQ